MLNTPNFRILLIDDTESIHKDFIKILIKDESSTLTQLENFLEEETNTPKLLLPHYQIDSALQGQEGVALIKKSIEDKNPYALAFVDLRMPPGWDGVETIKNIWHVDPNVQIVLCTAYSDYSWEEIIGSLGQEDNLLILKKPFDNIVVKQLALFLTKKWQNCNH